MTSHEERVTLRESLTRRVVPLILVTVLAFASVGCRSGRDNDGAGPEPSEAAVSVLEDFNGSGDRTTSAFNTGGRWKIEWSHTSKRFSITVLGDGDLGQVVDRIAPGSGETSALPDGTYRLRVDASRKGDWTIRIVEPS